MGQLNTRPLRQCPAIHVIEEGRCLILQETDGNQRTDIPADNLGIEAMVEEAFNY